MGESAELFGRIYQKGDVIFREGESGEDMYIIQSGAVEVSRHQGVEKIHVNFLEKGDFFGEMALVDNKPRSATVTAISRTRLLPVSKNIFTERTAQDWDTVLFLIQAICRRIDRLTQIIRTKAAKNTRLQKSLSKRPVASDAECLPDTDISISPVAEQSSSRLNRGHTEADIFSWVDADPISSSTQLIHLRPGDIVFEFGDTGDRMYIVVKGTLEIYLQEDGTQCRFALLGPGDFFGEMALFTDARRSASVRAVSPALVRPVGRDDMLATVKSDPDARQFF